MQLRCQNCQTMFALNRETVQTAYEQIIRENLHHYDAHCPKCRRAVYVTRQQLEWFNPWVKSQPAEGAAGVTAAPPARKPVKTVTAPQPVRAPVEQAATPKTTKAPTKGMSAAKPAKITKKSKPAKKAPPKKK